MSDRPIIFAAPMVRALLDGRKTQTRRIFTPPKPFAPDDDIAVQIATGTMKPRYAPGDRLWVREAWARNANQISDTRMDASVMYRADGETRAQDNGVDLPWRPSIHMPRWASRLTLAVTGVKVERLQDISEADATAEGCWKGRATGRAYDNVAALRLGGPEWKNARDWFADLWEGLHGEGSWDANPWVVAITFTVHKVNIDAMEKAA